MAASVTTAPSQVWDGDQLVDRTSVWSGSVIDADLHVVPTDPGTILGYLKEGWEEYAREKGFQGGSWLRNGPAIVYPPNLPTTLRPAWKREDGGVAGSQVSHLQEAVLDPWGVDAAIVSCYYGIDSIRHPDFSAVLASALNDWLIAEFLEKDPRLRGSLTLSAHNIQASVEEIERLGSHPQIVQVFMPVRSSEPYGKRHRFPIYEAAERQGLVLGIHYGGSGDGPPTGAGWPSWFAEEHSAAIQLFWTQLLSMIAEGVFEKFPTLKVAVLECGFTFVPSMMWRLDKEWKGLRRDIPWVKRPPSQVLTEQVRYAVQPIDAGPPEHMARILEEIGTEDILMFSTDYPHEHIDRVQALLEVMPESMRANVMSETARRFYGIE